MQLVAKFDAVDERDRYIPRRFTDKPQALRRTGSMIANSLPPGRKIVRYSGGDVHERVDRRSTPKAPIDLPSV